MSLFEFPNFNAFITIIVYVLKVLLEISLIKIDKITIRDKIFRTGIDLSFFGMTIFFMSIAIAIASGKMKFDSSNSREFNIFITSIFIFLIVIIITIVTYKVALILSAQRITRLYNKTINILLIVLCIGINQFLGFLALGYGIGALKFN